MAPCEDRPPALPQRSHSASARAGSAAAREDSSRGRRTPRNMGGAGPAPDIGQLGGSVRVVCRLRPMSEREKKAGTVPAASASTERREIAVVRMLGGGARQVRSQFHFDEVLTSFSTQSEVFAATLDPLVDEVLAGYEATAFAYGQTGTGKTYTMEGDLDSDAARGLVPRTAAAVIDRLSKGKYADYSISCSYLELYNEELSDLLAPSHIPQPKLDLKDVGSGRGVVCTGLSEVPVASLADILDLVRRAQERRRVAETRINARSSRSHCIFTLKVKCRRLVAAGELENSGKLHLVDLAGSECAKKAAPVSDDSACSNSADKKSGVSDEDRERKNINQSLLTLGRVITALRDGTGRIPYRDSKLTRLLQDALGGRCKTVIIATVSPALNAVEETISTLSYAEQASGVRNRPVATSLLRTIRLAANSGGNIPDMGAAFTGGGSGSSSDWAELEMKIAYLNQEVEEAQAALAVQYREVEEQMDRASLAESRQRDAEHELEAVRCEKEEQAFLASSFASFADGRVDATAVLSAALDASLAHGQDLSRLLAQRAERTSCARRQARDAIDESSEQNAQITASIAKAAVRLEALAREAHTAHRTSADAAAELTQEQEHALDGLLIAVHGGAQRLEKTLAATACEAKAAVDESEAACSAASAMAEVAMQESVRAAEKGAETVTTILALGDEASEHRAISAREAIVNAQISLGSRITTAAQELSQARQSAQGMYDAQLARMEASIMDPLEDLVSQFEEVTKNAMEQHTALEDFSVQERGDERAERTRRQQLLDEGFAVKEAHVSANCIGQAAMHAALSECFDALTVGSSATEEVLSIVATTLSAAATCLQKASSSGSQAVAATLADADNTLTTGWAEQRSSLQELTLMLSTAVSSQRSANSGVALEKEASSASKELADATRAAVRMLESERDDIAEQVRELRSQRTAEAAAVAALTTQREALKVDAIELRSSVEALRKELAEGRGKLANLLSAQATTREKVMHAVTKALESELATMASELECGVAAVSEQLTTGDRLAEGVREQVCATEERGTETAAKVTSIVQDWSNEVSNACDKISAAQESAVVATEMVEGVVAKTGEQFVNIAKACEVWAGHCEGVATSVDAVVVKSGVLGNTFDELGSRWQMCRTRCTDASESWAQECSSVDSKLCSAASHNGAAVSKLSDLSLDVVAKHRKSEKALSAWKHDSEVHTDSLTNLTTSCDRCTLAGLEEAAQRQQIVESLGKMAGQMTASSRQHCTSLHTICSAVVAESDSLVLISRHGDVALQASVVAAEALADDAKTALAASSKSIDALRADQSETSLAISHNVKLATEAVADAITRGVAAECDQRSAMADAGKRARSLWTRAGDEHHKSLKALGSAADVAKDASKVAKLRGCDRVLAELEKGEKTESQAVSAAHSLGTETSAALDTYLKTLRSSLSADPLGAFEEKVDAAPRCPKAATRPEVEITRRPSQEQVLLDFRAIGAAAFAGKENAPELCCSSKVEGASEAIKEMPKENRVALAERNIASELE